MPVPRCPVHGRRLQRQTPLSGTSGRPFWKCNHRECTVGWWGNENVTPADQPTRTARQKLLRFVREILPALAETVNEAALAYYLPDEPIGQMDCAMIAGYLTDLIADFPETAQTVEGWFGVGWVETNRINPDTAGNDYITLPRGMVANVDPLAPVDYGPMLEAAERIGRQVAQRQEERILQAIAGEQPSPEPEPEPQPLAPDAVIQNGDCVQIGSGPMRRLSSRWHGMTVSGFAELNPGCAVYRGSEAMLLEIQQAERLRREGPAARPAIVDELGAGVEIGEPRPSTPGESAYAPLDEPQPGTINWGHRGAATGEYMILTDDDLLHRGDQYAADGERWRDIPSGFEGITVRDAGTISSQITTRFRRLRRQTIQPAPFQYHRPLQEHELLRAGDEFKHPLGERWSTIPLGWHSRTVSRVNVGNWGFRRPITEAEAARIIDELADLAILPGQRVDVPAGAVYHAINQGTSNSQAAQPISYRVHNSWGPSWGHAMAITGVDRSTAPEPSPRPAEPEPDPLPALPPKRRQFRFE